MRDTLDPISAGAADTRTQHRHMPRLEYRIYYALIFTLSLPVAVIRTVLPRPNRWGLAPRRGVWGEAQAMARAITPILFDAR